MQLEVIFEKRDGMLNFVYILTISIYFIELDAHLLFIELVILLRQYFISKEAGKKSKLSLFALISVQKAV